MLRGVVEPCVTALRREAAHGRAGGLSWAGLLRGALRADRDRHRPARLAAEIIFDRGLGDLFVVRTAGHAMGPEVIGSIEYGVDVLDCPLVVVLGHDSCGAVGAACAAPEDGMAPAGYIRDVVERGTPSVLAARAAGRVSTEEILAEHMGDIVDLSLYRSRLLAERVAAGQAAVVGLRYSLADGTARLVAARGLAMPVGSAL
ncbi:MULTISPECIES: carbonic anhydrase [Streptomyces]|uniref:carbonic anhydrase n=1 Tax=Streptomyces TaxID=1883 RepID=UPI00099D35CD|nr:carbonic anhydrase [Streptomyces durhamensis]